jgi:hypothetical protein
MNIITNAGKYIVAKAVWNEGMRGHFIRMFSTTGPQDIEIMVSKIETEAALAERERIKAAVYAIPTAGRHPTEIKSAVLSIIEEEK